LASLTMFVGRAVGICVGSVGEENMLYPPLPELLHVFGVMEYELLGVPEHCELLQV